MFNKTLTLFISFAYSTLFAQSQGPILQEKKPIQTIAFGSCNFQFRPQPIWNKVIENKPDVWIWLGDNIYADTHDTAVLRAKYNQQLANPDYQKLLAKVPVIGTWDDHDYGVNDGDETYSEKKHSQQIFCDFMNESPYSPRRKRSGIYTSYTYGTPEQSVKIILLDTRFNKQKPSKTADMLGEEQWTWFEKELLESKSQINIIGTSIQVLAKKQLAENWYEFPKSVERLYALLKKHGKQNVIFISGDVHCGEIMKSKPEKGMPDFTEVTSSGLTHTNLFDLEDNKFALEAAYNGFNFAILKIQWGSPIIVKAEIHNKKNKVEREVEIVLK